MAAGAVMTKLEFSLNEVETTTRKASVGAGLPYGIAEEFGRAARWLSARGFDGLIHAVDFLDSGEYSPEEKVTRAVRALFILDQLVWQKTSEVSPNTLPPTPIFFGLCGQLAEVLGVEVVLAIDDDRFSTAGPLRLPGQARATLAHLSLGPAEPSPAEGERRPLAIAAETVSRALALCALTSVPASAESRTRGAGTVQTDND